MTKCDICGEEANKHLFTMTIEKNEPRCIADICEKCEAELAEAIVCIANKRMREIFGSKALIIPNKTQISPNKQQSESEGKE